MGCSFSLGPGKEDVAAICQVAKGDKAIQAVRMAGAKARKSGRAQSPGVVSVLGEEGACERRRVEGVGE